MGSSQRKAKLRDSGKSELQNIADNSPSHTKRGAIPLERNGAVYCVVKGNTVYVLGNTAPEATQNYLLKL
jgi:hypothetical protein